MKAHQRSIVCAADSPRRDYLHHRLFGWRSRRRPTTSSGTEQSSQIACDGLRGSGVLCASFRSIFSLSIRLDLSDLSSLSERKRFRQLLSCSCKCWGSPAPNIRALPAGQAAYTCIYMAHSTAIHSPVMYTNVVAYSGCAYMFPPSSASCARIRRTAIQKNRINHKDRIRIRNKQHCENVDSPQKPKTLKE